LTFFASGIRLFFPLWVQSRDDVSRRHWFDLLEEIREGKEETTFFMFGMSSSIVFEFGRLGR